MGDEGGATEQWEEEVRFNKRGWDHVTTIGNISMGDYRLTSLYPQNLYVIKMLHSTKVC